MRSEPWLNKLLTWVPQVDPESRAHVDAYLLAKMQHSRVTVQQVLHIIRAQELTVESSSSQTSTFYVVPRSNFPKSLSPEQQKWLVTKQELEARYEVHDDNTDYDQMYVFMDACCRAGLGKWINTLRFTAKMARKNRDVRIPVSTTVIDSNQTAAGVATSRASTANDGLGSSKPVESAGKKRRLQQHLSTTSSDEEEKTLTEILVRCDKAAEAGRI